jgi:nitrogen fixation-related uncharacterized protein
MKKVYIAKCKTPSGLAGLLLRVLPVVFVGCGAALLLRCSNPVDKRPRQPVLSVVSDTTVSVKDSLVLVAHAAATGGKATGYTWTLDGRTLAAPAAADSVCRLFFGIPDTGGHIAIVKASGAGNTVSEPESVKVTVLLHPPVVRFVTRDTAVFPNDTVRFAARGTDSNGTIIAYRWSIDTGGAAITSPTGTLSYTFPPLALSHRILVEAMDNDSILSAPDSILVRVVIDHPRILAQRDTAVAINDTAVLHATRIDTFATPVQWLWAVDETTFSDTAAVPTLPLSFSRAQAGQRVVFVKAIDAHGLASNVDSTHVYVHLYPPTVSITHDTAVVVNDPVTLHAHGLDTNGRVVKYLWAIGGTHFSDTTLGDSIVHVWSRADTGKNIVVYVKAIDDDTLASGPDSMHVTLHLKPLPVVTPAHDTTVFINDTFSLVAQAAPGGGVSPATKFVWALDNQVFADTTATGRRSLRFSRADTGRHVVRVKAMDTDTMVSLAESTVVTVRLGTPLVKAMSDTAVFINDSVTLHAAGSDTNGTVVRYLWSFDKGQYSDTTASGSVRMAWSKQDTGRHTVRVKAVDDDTLQSRPDSFSVLVRVCAPLVKAMGDTAVFINDSATLHAAGSDTNGQVVRYLWSVDKGQYADTTASGSVRMAWGKQDTGRHTVRVKAVDNDSLQSRPDSFFVQVRLGMPVIRPFRDTAVSWGDTLTLAVAASDTNGTIVQYLWNAAGGGSWTDSSAHDTIRLTSSIHTRKRVVVAVRDDDGLVAADTFAVTFLAKPCYLSAQGLRPLDTLLTNSLSAKPYSFPLSLGASRLDGIADTFTFSLWLGTSPNGLAQVYQGPNTACTLSVPDTGAYYWRFLAIDTHNDTATAGSVLRIMLQRRICFVGHSIVTGFGGTSGLGGFRRMIVDTLRAVAGLGERIKCEGPVFTTALLPASDDSCIAVVGKTSAQIYDSLENHSSTSADIWVYMCGVNEGYQFPLYYWPYGLNNYAPATLDEMHNRNPQSEIYVINAIPFPKDTGGDFNEKADSMFKANLPGFNHMLDTAVTARRQTWLGRGEGGVWLVDAFDSLAKLPDSTRDSVYFSDYLHPNQTGYNRLGRAILDAMRIAGSLFLK